MEYEIKPPSKTRIGLAELWEYRELFYFFTWRDIKVKYKQTVLGFFWAILQPFLMMVIFSVLLGERLYDPASKVPYPVFIFSGLLLWNIFSSGITAAGNSMVTNSNIIKKIYFPRLIIPISSVLVSLFDFMMAFFVFIGILLYYETPVDLMTFTLMLPLSLLITCVGTFGIGSWLAALNIKYRDFRYIIPFMIQALLFVTPVIYSFTIIRHEWLKYVLAVNPMHSAIELFRHGIVQEPIDSTLLLISITSTLIFFVVGLYYFRKTENYFADIA
jgi:lipopolysaccharide transport system permease protein